MGYAVKKGGNMMIKKAIYPGFFDPFTNGHLDIVKKAAVLFDEVYVVIGVNSAKRRSFAPEGMKEAIESTLRSLGLNNCSVCIYEGLVAEFARVNGIAYMIRGLRNNMDYNYEENIASVNTLINPNMESIFFRAENAALSSSMVKELNCYHFDVSRYVPAAVLAYIQGKH